MTTGVGDIATVNLTVAEGDITTEVTFAVTSPAGAASAPAVTGGPTAWTAQVPLTEAGRWTGILTVTGAGEGTEPWELLAAPNPPGSRRTYATTADLADWLDDAPPAGATRMLAIATRRIDQALMTSVYPVDDDSMPTDAAHIIALRDATCAQVEYMVETGDTSGQGTALSYASVSIGSVSLSRAGSGNTASGGRTTSAEAIDILHRAGLLPGQPYTY